MDKSAKIGKIISEIHKKSISREIEWEEIEEGKFQLRFPNSSVVMTINRDYEAQDDYIALEIYNREGIRVLEINGGNIGKYWQNATSKILSEIYASAKESILKTDETLDDIFDSLESGFSYPSSSSSKSSSSYSSSKSKISSPDGEDIPF